MSDLGKYGARFGSHVLAICLCTAAIAGCATGKRQAVSLTTEQEQPDTPSTDFPSPGSATQEALPAVPEPPAAIFQPTGTWVPLQAWCQGNGLPPLRQVTVEASPSYALTTPSGVFITRVGSTSARWDGIEVRLGFPPQLMDGQPCLHTLDLTKTLEPMTRLTFLGFLKMNPTIVIDPGHGGADSGTRSVLGYGFEKDYTLDWARRLGGLLAAKGCRVFLTRTTDTDMSLANRVAFADAHQADVFLSLHFNSAAPDQRQAGLETYCVTPVGMPSSLTRGFEDDATLDFPNNAFDEQNLQLALLVHRALLQVNGHLDRGVRRARYLSVLRGQNRPAILLEGGYLSNPSEARSIASPLYRHRLAEAVAGVLTGD